MCLTITQAFSVDRNSVYKSIKEKANNSKSIHIIFKMSEDNPELGEIYAKRGGKYKLNLKNNVIISNGSSVWNVQPGKTVAISEYEDNNSLSLEVVFFDLLKDMKAVDLNEINSSMNDYKYKLALKPNENSKFRSNVNNLILYLDNNLNIKKIDAEASGGNYTYIIDNMRINPPLDDDMFEFKIPEDMEVIDFR